MPRRQGGKVEYPEVLAKVTQVQEEKAEVAVKVSQLQQEKAQLQDQAATEEQKVQEIVEAVAHQLLSPAAKGRWAARQMARDEALRE